MKKTLGILMVLIALAAFAVGGVLLLMAGENDNSQMTANTYRAPGMEDKMDEEPPPPVKPLPSAGEQKAYVTDFLSGKLNWWLSIDKTFNGSGFFFKSFDREAGGACSKVFSALKSGDVTYVEPDEVEDNLDELKDEAGLEHCPVPEKDGYGVGYQFIEHPADVRITSQFGRQMSERRVESGFRPSLFVMNGNVAVFDVARGNKNLRLISSDEFCRSTDTWDDWNDSRQIFGIKPCIRPVYMEFSPKDCRVHRVLERFGRFEAPNEGRSIRVLAGYGRGDGRRFIPKVSSGVFKHSGQPYYFNIGYASNPGVVGRVAVIRFGRLFDEKNNPSGIPDCEYTTYLSTEEAKQKQGIYSDVDTGSSGGGADTTPDTIADDFIRIAGSTRNFLKNPDPTLPKGRCLEGIGPVTYAGPVEWVTLGSCPDMGKPASPFLARWNGPIRIGFDWNWAARLYTPKRPMMFPGIPVDEDAVKAQEQALKERMPPDQWENFKARQNSELRKITLEYTRQIIDPDGPEYLYQLKRQDDIKRIVEAALPELRRITGLDIQIVTGADVANANFIIRPGGPPYFSRNVFRLPRPNDGRGGSVAITSVFEGDLSGAVRMTPFARSQVDGYFIPDADGAIKQTVCHVYRELPDNLFQALVHECLVRGLGLPNLSETAVNSLLGPWARTFEPEEAGNIFARGTVAGEFDPDLQLVRLADRWGEYAARAGRMNAPGITAFEKSMLQLLYSPLFKPGMSVSKINGNTLRQFFDASQKDGGQ